MRAYLAVTVRIPLYFAAPGQVPQSAYTEEQGVERIPSRGLFNDLQERLVSC